jgi:integrase/recombinase XerD
VKDPSRARVTSPLERYAPGFVAELARLGYTGNSASGQMFVMGHLSRWLAAEGLDTSGLTPEVADRFLAARRAAGYVLYLSPKALVPLLTYLRSSGVIPPAPAAAPASPVEALLDRYRRYLVTERGLTPGRRVTVSAAPESDREATCAAVMTGRCALAACLVARSGVLPGGTYPRGGRGKG